MQAARGATLTSGTLVFGFDGDGGLGDRLLAAALAGVKTATSSLLIEYSTGDPLPLVGQRLVLTDHAGRAHGTVETTAVETTPIELVGDDVAHGEGEGYADAAAWRRGHLRFWADVTPLIRDEIGDPHWRIAPGEPVVVHWFRLVPGEVSDSPPPTA